MNEQQQSALILIVDDEPAIIYSLSKSLQRVGHRTEVAVDGKSALEAAQKLLPDLMILDFRLPDITGIIVLQELRKNPTTALIPVIMLTGYPSENSIRSAFDLGVSDFMMKPFTSAELRMRIDLAVARSQRSASKPLFDHHIFLSYSRIDKPVKQRLTDDFRATDLKLWVDEDDLHPGTMGWELEISRAIRGAGCVVAILSPDAEQSSWVGRELACAETMQKRIFPILTRGTEQDAIPFRLMSHQWVDARHNYNEAFGKLLTAVKKYLSLP